MRWMDEIVALHDFFEAYYLGREDDIARAADAFHPDMTFVGPNGTVLARPEIVAMIEQGHGHSTDLRITTSDHTLLHQSPETVVASYIEHHELADGGNRRLSTVVFVPDETAPLGLLWLRVHETWLPTD